jgi:hypothetical protein
MRTVDHAGDLSSERTDLVVISVLSAGRELRRKGTDSIRFPFWVIMTLYLPRIERSLASGHYDLSFSE